MADLPDNDDFGLVDIPVPEQISTGKSNNDFRPFVMRANFLDKSTGSGYVELGRTCVLCSIEGPFEKDREADDDVEDDSVVNIISNDLSEEYLTALDQIVETFVKTELLVNAEVKVYMKLVSDDGGVLAACAMALGLALASANIQMYDMPLAATVLFESQRAQEIVLDPTVSQCKKALENGGGFVTVISLPNFTQIGHVLSEGILTLKQVKFATNAAFMYSLTLHERLEESLKSSL